MVTNNFGGRVHNNRLMVLSIDPSPPPPGAASEDTPPQSTRISGVHIDISVMPFGLNSPHSSCGDDPIAVATWHLVLDPVYHTQAQGALVRQQKNEDSLFTCVMKLARMHNKQWVCRG